MREEIVPLGYQGSYQRVRASFRDKRLSPGPVTARPPSPESPPDGSSADPTGDPHRDGARSAQGRSEFIALKWTPSPATSAPSVTCSPSARANGCRSGSMPSGKNPLPGLHTLAQASAVTAMQSSPASPFPGDLRGRRRPRQPDQDASARCSAGPAFIFSASAFSWRDESREKLLGRLDRPRRE